MKACNCVNDFGRAQTALTVAEASKIMADPSFQLFEASEACLRYQVQNFSQTLKDMEKTRQAMKIPSGFILLLSQEAGVDDHCLQHEEITVWKPFLRSYNYIWYKPGRGCPRLGVANDDLETSRQRYCAGRE